MSNRLYTAEASDRESTLISQNTILTLGHVGVSLKDVPKTTESVTQVLTAWNAIFGVVYSSCFHSLPLPLYDKVLFLFSLTPLLKQIFQQRFCSPPSQLDVLIVDQLGCISIAASHMQIYKEIMGMFVEINLQAASATYAKGW